MNSDVLLGRSYMASKSNSSPLRSMTSFSLGWAPAMRCFGNPLSGCTETTRRSPSSSLRKPTCHDETYMLSAESSYVIYPCMSRDRCSVPSRSITLVASSLRRERESTPPRCVISGMSRYEKLSTSLNATATSRCSPTGLLCLAVAFMLASPTDYCLSSSSYHEAYMR